MKLQIFCVLLLKPYFVSSILIDTRNYDKSLVFFLESTSTQHDGQLASRLRRSARNSVELLAFKVESNIRYRYSRTYVTSHVRNLDDRAQEVTFQVILPETAFISKFFMEIEGKTYEAYVKGKEEAKKDYTKAQSRGQSAGLLELNTRHSNVFNVNVNIRAYTIVNFNLTYEELLSRRFGRYEQSININGDEISKTSDVEVVVNIEESQPLGFLKAFNLQNELESSVLGNSENSDAKVVRHGDSKAQILWRPSTKFENLRRFIVQYDITREIDSGEVLIMNGYFVHYFAPPNLKPLQKHVVFVLDTSGSMYGRRISQMQQAMSTIITDLKADDYINMITFSSNVVVWSPGDTYQEREPWRDERNKNIRDDLKNLQPFPANSRNLQLAKMYVDSLIASGGTNINDALIQGLKLTARVKRARNDYSEKGNRGAERDTGTIETRSEVLPPHVETLIIFLTDGEPTVGVTDLNQIQRNIQLANIGLSVPIFSLAFGQDADFPFLRQISLKNHAFGRKIYEAADSALQLQGFYGEISSPLLSNVVFNYTSTKSLYKTHEITKRRFPTFFEGWEIAVAGRIEQPGADRVETVRRPVQINNYSPDLIKYIPTDHCHFYTTVSGTGYDGVHHWRRPLIYMRHSPWWCKPLPHTTTTTTVRPDPSQEDSFLERLWAYLTIQNLIEKDMLGSSWKDESPKQKALRLALKYGFVTAQTSLVVVKPDDVRDVASAESTDNLGKKKYQRRHSHKKYTSGGGSTRLPFANRGHSRVKSMKRLSSIDDNDGDNVAKTHMQVMSESKSKKRMSTKSTTTAALDDPNEADLTATTSGPITPMSKSKQQKSTTTISTELTLGDIKWLTGSKLTISVVEYQVAKSMKETSNTDAGTECTLGNKGSKFNSVTGICQHLKNCILKEFTDDFDIYKETYFCSIKSRSSSDTYAGVCCTRS